MIRRCYALRRRVMRDMRRRRYVADDAYDVIFRLLLDAITPYAG